MTTAQALFDLQPDPRILPMGDASPMKPEITNEACTWRGTNTVLLQATEIRSSPELIMQIERACATGEALPPVPKAALDLSHQLGIRIVEDRAMPDGAWSVRSSRSTAIVFASGKWVVLDMPKFPLWRAAGY